MTDYTKYSSVQLKKLVSLRKIPERSSITRKDQMISALRKYDENPNDVFGLKKYMKTLLGLDKLQTSKESQVQMDSETQQSQRHFLTLSSFEPSQDLFSNFGDDTESMMSDLSMLPDVVPTEIQYPNLKTSQDVVRLEMSRNEYDVLVKMVDDYEKMRHKKQMYDQTAKNKRIQQRNLMLVQEGKEDKVKPFVELKPFVKQMTLDKFIVK